MARGPAFCGTERQGEHTHEEVDGVVGQLSLFKSRTDCTSEFDLRTWPGSLTADGELLPPGQEAGFASMGHDPIEPLGRDRQHRVGVGGHDGSGLRRHAGKGLPGAGAQVVTVLDGVGKVGQRGEEDLRLAVGPLGD